MKKTAIQNVFALLLFAVFIFSLAMPAVMAQGSDFIPDASNEVALADTVMPTDVENLTATAGNAKVILSWDVASDNDIVAGYKIYYGTASVTADGGEYNLGVIDAGNVIEYSVSSLVNDTKYYFAVTAYDPAGNESENYSYEVSAKPVGESGDSVAPTVAKAEALNKYNVLVTFSEPVTLPAQNSAEAFSIIEDGSGIALQVLSAANNLNDVTGKSILLTTAKLTGGVNYILTAGIQIQDKEGNPIESGTSDTALFVGTDKEPAAFGAAEETIASADMQPPMVESAIAVDSTHILIKFSEPVQLGIDPVSNFIITEEGNFSALLEIIDAELELDDMSVTLMTAPQGPVSYNLITQDTVLDIAGNALEPAKNAIVFIGKSAAQEDPTDTDLPPVDDANETPGMDTTAPEDATKFMAKVLEGMVAGLSWNPSVNTAGDLANYVLYKSTDGVAFSEGVLVDPTAKAFNVSNLSPGIKYFFKLAAKDATGNESTGVMTSLILPETGPELVLLLAASLGIGRVFGKKNKKSNRK